MRMGAKEVGSAGHAFIAHTKALSPSAHTKDRGYGMPPHPLAARSGQRFWPLQGARRRPFVIRKVTREHVVAVREGGRVVRISLPRLLAADDDSSGRHYRFQGFASRRYQTFACVWSAEEVEVVLCVPEWHPRRPLYLFSRLVPECARRPGEWLSLRCDLSASSAARLEPSDLEPAQDPGSALMHRPNLVFGSRSPTPSERRRARAAHVSARASDGQPT